ncbi:MAG: hypothetical protein U9M90_01805 [Patescibacteria group bacterium]|nr:hypothetical protein [Patescibacteria group bacterium]
MKKVAVIVGAMFFCMTMTTSIAHAIDAKRLEKIEIAGQNNGKDLFAGTVKVADLNRKPVAEAVPIKAIKTVPASAKAALSSRQVVIAMPMEGEWFRLGSRYCGTKTIYDFVLQVCKRDFTKSVLADNYLTFEEAKRLGIGHKVFVRHIYLKDEYKFSLEKAKENQRKPNNLSQQEVNNLRKALKNAGKETIALRGELKKTRRFLAKKTEAISLKDNRIRELEETNSDLKKQIAEKSAAANKAQELFIQLAEKTVDPENGENATMVAKALQDKQNIDASLIQIEDLKKQLAERTNELEGAEHTIHTFVNEEAHLKRDLKTERGEHAELKNSFNILKAKQELLSTEHADLKEMFKQQMAAFNNLGQKIETGFDRLEKEKAELKAQIKQLKVELETAQKQLKECQKKTFISS